MKRLKMSDQRDAKNAGNTEDGAGTSTQLCSLQDIAIEIRIHFDPSKRPGRSMMEDLAVKY